VGGQAVDIQWEGKKADLPVVKFMHTHKTGALITASVASGAILGGADGSQIETITAYGEKIGLAFQISDDILDIEGDSKTMGKQAGADEQKGKMTYPAVLGLNESKKYSRNWFKQPSRICGNSAAGPSPCARLPDILLREKNEHT